MLIDGQVRALVPGDAFLGEGPVWDRRENALWWVDIKGGSIFRWRESDGDVARFTPPFQIASLVPAGDHGFIAGTARGFARIDPVENIYVLLADPEAHLSGNRFNDGKADRYGAMWAGTMHDAEAEVSGSLYRIDHRLLPRRLDDGYSVSNGPAFDRSGARMYHTDSARRTIFAFDLDERGDPIGKRVFLKFADGHGYPDGMTVDAEDALWVAFWDGWCLRRYDPDAILLTEIAMPVARPTSVAFGGAALDILFVTSARVGLDSGALATQPLAGSLFAFRPGPTGLADTLFAWEAPDL